MPYVGREQLPPPQPPPSLLSLPNSEIPEAAGGSRQQMLCAPDVVPGVSKGAKGNVVLARLVLGVGPECAESEDCGFARSPWGRPTSASRCPRAPVLLERPRGEKPSAAPCWHKAGKNRYVAGTGGGFITAGRILLPLLYLGKTHQAPNLPGISLRGQTWSGWPCSGGAQASGCRGGAVSEACYLSLRALPCARTGLSTVEFLRLCFVDRSRRSA